MVRVAVIGAGPSGTAALRAFQSAASKGAEIPEVVCYEKQEDLGGLWNYSWRTGVDAHGEPVHNGMYRYLWSNGPKEALEFADYSFQEHFGKPIPSFPPREVLFDYIRGRVDKADVRKWIRFNHAIRDVSFSEETKKFTLVARNLLENSDSTEEFDNVIVASGHYSTPNVPYFPGFEKFEGRVLHAHDFRDAREFEGKDILIIGTSYSAEDIASQCYKYGCKSITLSWRTKPMPYHWPESFTTVPLLTKVVGNTAHFKDGSTKDVHAIILCTGYQHHFPFMCESLRLKTTNRLWPDSLYRGTVWEKNPKLFYMGMQDQVYTFNMFDAQAWYIRDVILGRQTIPSLEEMKVDFAAWREKEAKVDTDEDKIRFQAEHMKGLMELTDYPNFDVEKTVQSFLEWGGNKQAGIMTFRDAQHTSVLTGNTSPVHHTPWLQALDDSMECYMRTDQQSSK